MESTGLHFVHLRNHSDYSLHQGAIRCQQLAQFSATQPIPCIALTDDNNLFATIKFYRAARQQNVKPILGIDCRIMTLGSSRPYMWTLLAMNNIGLENLKKISTKAFTSSDNKNNVYVSKDYVFEHNEGLIAFSGGGQGQIGQHLLHGNLALAKAEMEQVLQHFQNRFYLEIQRTGKEYEERYIADILVLAEMFQCPVIATNNSCFTTAEDYYSHEIKVCIQRSVLITDDSRTPEHTEQQYLKSSEEMVELFKDIPEAVANTVEVATRCTVDIELGKVHLPSYELEEGQSFDGQLRELAIEGLHKRIPQKSVLATPYQNYTKRLEKELAVISKTDFSAYFLIVHEFIQWSHDHDIPVGPGRGSAAGSLVAYCLAITDIDPIKYGLLFERFLNEERVSMPDMDIDFSVDGRERVIQHVTEKYGQKAVGQIITFGTMAAKNAIRDVCRVLGHPYSFGDMLSKLLPNTPGITLKKAIDQSEELKEIIKNDERVPEIIEISGKLEGMARHVGTHAAGVVIAPSNLLNYTPLYYDPVTKITVSQFDKDDIEHVGLVKFDFLGLKTLTIIESTVQSIRETCNIPVDMTSIPLDDPRVYELFCKGDTDSVFQVESTGMRRSLRKLAPTTFDEIIAMLALYRPGPMQFIDDFIDGKHGRIETTYLHPKLEPIVKDTYAIVVYQEQVMRIAQDLAGYTLGNADILRRAMGKKDSKIMAQEKEKFLSGMASRDIEPNLASQIYGFIEKFAEYGFNKSHSAAYAIIAYQTAWLKTYYPIDFFTAVMNSDILARDKVYQSYQNCKKRGITILPPHVNHSAYKFTINDKNEIVYGLGALKSVGAVAAQAFSEEQKLAPFRNMYDFCQRIDRKALDLKTLEALICAGAFDGLGSTRAELLSTTEQALLLSEQTRDNWQQGTGDLFGGVDTKDISLYRQNNKDTEWNASEILDKEWQCVGFYLTGHPLDKYQQELEQIVTHDLKPFAMSGELPKRADKAVVAGVVIALKRFINDSKQTAYHVVLDDGNCHAQFTVLDSVLPRANTPSYSRGNTAVLQLSIQRGRKFQRVEVETILPFHEARFHLAKALRITLSGTTPIQSAISSLRSVLAQHLAPKGKPVFVQFIKEGVATELRLGEHWKLEVNDVFLHSLHAQCPNSDINPVY